MWNETKSLALSKLCVKLFMALLIGFGVSAPFWLRSLLAFYSELGLETFYACFLMTIYACCVPAALLLYHLYRLLNNIGLDQIFNAENVRHLRVISWCCITAGLVCLISGLYYLPWLLLAVAAAFIGLILRVVKNVVQLAVVLKDENDYTI